MNPDSALSKTKCDKGIENELNSIEGIMENLSTFGDAATLERALLSLEATDGKIGTRRN